MVYFNQLSGTHAPESSSKYLLTPNLCLKRQKMYFDQHSSAKATGSWLNTQHPSQVSHEYREGNVSFCYITSFYTFGAIEKYIFVALDLAIGPRPKDSNIITDLKLLVCHIRF